MVVQTLDVDGGGCDGADGDVPVAWDAVFGQLLEFCAGSFFGAWGRRGVVVGAEEEDAGPLALFAGADAVDDFLHSGRCFLRADELAPAHGRPEHVREELFLGFEVDLAADGGVEPGFWDGGLVGEVGYEGEEDGTVDVEGGG